MYKHCTAVAYAKTPRQQAVLAWDMLHDTVTKARPPARKPVNGTVTRASGASTINPSDPRTRSTGPNRRPRTGTQGVSEAGEGKT